MAAPRKELLPWRESNRAFPHRRHDGGGQSNILNALSIEMEGSMRRSVNSKR